MLIRKKRGASGAWRVHEADARTALHMLACGIVLRSRLIAAESAERFVAEGYAIKTAGFFALSGRGVVAALLSPAVWGEAWRKRRTSSLVPELWARMPRGYPLVLPAHRLAQAVGRAPFPATEELPDATVRGSASTGMPLVDAAEAARVSARWPEPGDLIGYRKRA